MNTSVSVHGDKSGPEHGRAEPDSRQEQPEQGWTAAQRDLLWFQRRVGNQAVVSLISRCAASTPSLGAHVLGRAVASGLPVQRSPLSDQLTAVQGQPKGSVFDLLRQHGPAASDGDARRVLEARFAAGTDD